jgi:hypothetical protein
MITFFEITGNQFPCFHLMSGLFSNDFHDWLFDDSDNGLPRLSLCFLLQHKGLVGLEVHISVGLGPGVKWPSKMFRALNQSEIWILIYPLEVFCADKHSIHATQINKWVAVQNSGKKY